MLKEAYDKIKNNLEEIEKLYKECTDLAEEHSVMFSAVELGYGMGGEYIPRAIADKFNYEVGWKASSQSC